ncbi:hypothetical protein SCUP234_02195 [Seiridium cupressi]
MPAPLVWINGFPGTGKLTVAKALQKMNKTVILIDNHQLIDPVEAKFSRSHPDYQRQRQIQRQAAFAQHVCSSSSLSRPVVFTDFQSTSEPGPSVAKEYQAAAKEAGRPFLPIYLTCDEQENIERVSSKERLSSGTTKLTSRELLRSFRSTTTLHQFDGIGLSIDVTSSTPDEAASRIVEHMLAHETD